MRDKKKKDSRGPSAAVPPQDKDQAEQEIQAPAGQDAAAETSPRFGEIWVEPVTGMEMIWVPGGTFQMGCGEWDGVGDEDEFPAHMVTVDGFYLGKTEVTQGQWKKVMDTNPSAFDKGDNYPVENVSWYQAQEFIKRLTAHSQNRYKLRLPTEAEWEYAARSGGRMGKYAGGDFLDRVAWYAYNSSNSTHPVATRQPNGLGFYDMSGNVWEWCEDVYDKEAYHQAAPRNPIFLGNGTLRTNRGGSWGSGPGSLRCASRGYLPPHEGFPYVGFRLLRGL